MKEIDAINTEGVVLDKADMAMTELPPVPQWMTDQINELAGFTGEYPNVRLVSGLDPNIQEFYAGEWHRKYIRRESVIYQYNILHRPNGTQTILTPAEAKKVTPKMGILLPVTEREVKEYGIPRYFLELYKSPENYGSPEAWQEHRYLEADDPTNLSGKKLDLLGDFPMNGGYDTWFAIEEPVFNSLGKVASTKFKPLDEDVMEFIRYMIESVKGKSSAEQHKEKFEQAQNMLDAHIKETKEFVKDAVKDNLDRIWTTPKIVVPSTYEKK